ncbi:Anaphase-promoting complex (APC), subunit 11 [Handroanthus impetiginosus]|uniref:Anaphase-promoting complex (APC), subunit 11 n=1 Tax=Handroanthus impetiginosus TaxID=429701 RepID=A0A2G9GNM3_9LAMI|nr:Anaphase-promoting complex (APC), subunit 11 [Handroanthus impetiginosus]
MDFQLQFLPEFTKSFSFLNKFHGDSGRPAAAVFDQNSETSLYCAICLSDIRGGDSYRKMPECGHRFHAQCIDTWFRSRSTCPLCRIQVPQIISLNEKQYEWSDLISNILLLFRNFVERTFNPLNDELTSMLCDNIRCIS